MGQESHLPEKLQILLIDENPRSAERVSDALRGQSLISVHIHSALTLDEGQAMMANVKIDIILFDLALDKSDLLHKVNRLAHAGGSVPLVVIAASRSDESRAIQALRTGARGYLVREELDSYTAARLLIHIYFFSQTMNYLDNRVHRYQHMLKTVGEGVIQSDRKGRVTMMNPSACRTLELEPTEGVDRLLGDVLIGQPRGQEGEDTLNYLSEALQGKENFGKDHIVLFSRTGKRLVVNCVSNPYFQGEQMSGIVLTMRNISEQVIIENKLKDAIQEQLKNEQKLVEALSRLRQLNTELHETRDQLIQAEKLQSVGRLAAGVAHEVKNPLAILLQGIEYLQGGEGEKSDDYKQVLEDMADAVQRADTVIKGLLDFAAPACPEMQEEDLHRVIDDSLGLIRHLVKKHSISVECDFSSEPLSVMLDKTTIQQVFVNLFSNAICAMKEKGNLRVSTAPLQEPGKNGHQARIIINDSGPGIPEELQGKLFDPFVTTRRGLGGTGLGLSVVKSIIEMHEGTISIENGQNGGAQVTITL